MPRIPFSLASGEVPRNLNAGQASPRGWSLTGSALENFGEQGVQTASLISAVERRVQDSRDRVTAEQFRSVLNTHMQDLIDKADPNLSGPAAEKWFAESAKSFVDDHIKAIENPVLQNGIRAASIESITQGAGKMRAVANHRIIEQTRTHALEQINDLTSAGDVESMKTATDFVSGLTDAMVFSAEEGNSLKKTIKKGSLENAFGRALSADPVAAHAVVNQRLGIFSELSDAEHQRYLAAAREKIHEDENYVWTKEQRTYALQERSRQEDDRVRKERSDNVAGEIGRRATTRNQDGTDPDINALIVEVNRRGPGMGGTGEMTEEAVRATVGYLHSLRTDQEKGDPESFARALSTITGAQSKAGLPSNAAILNLPGVGWKEKAVLLEHVASRGNMLQNESERLITQGLSRASVALEALTNTHGSMDPTLIARASEVRGLYTQELLKAERDKQDPWELWDTKLRPRVEQSLGSDVERSYRRVLNDLGGMGTEEEYEARIRAGYYANNDEGRRRDLNGLRRLSDIKDIMDRLKVKREEVTKEATVAKAIKAKQATTEAKRKSIEAETEATRPDFADVPSVWIAP